MVLGGDMNHLKSIQDAWLKLLLDYRAWYFPKTPQGEHWKTRAVHHAIRSCPSRMMDDVEAMLVEYRKNDNQQNLSEDKQQQKGTSSYLPIMLTATAMLDSLPMSSQINAVPYFNPVIVQDKPVMIRLEPIAVRCQIAFFATNSHDVRDVVNQFCTYLLDDTKRKIKVPFLLGYDDDKKAIYEPFGFTVFDNEVYPSSASHESLNLSIGTVDVTLSGCIPHVLGLGLGKNVDGGFDTQGIPKNPIFDLDKVVTQVVGKTTEQNFSIDADEKTKKVDVNYER